MMNESTAWHSLRSDQALDALQSSHEGLSSSEAADRLRQYGPNIIPESLPKTLLAVYLDQFKNAFIYLLLIAGVVSIFLSEYGDALFIAIALQLNAVIGTTQEWQAQVKALGLKTLIRSMVAVRRDQAWNMLDGSELVPGDIVELEAGTHVPAAMRLLADEGLEVDESLLTGESVPVTKHSDIELAEHVSLADRENMLHAGATIQRGRATAVVTATGPRTEVGRVAESLKFIEEIEPPLIRRMGKFTHIVAGLMTGIIGLIAIAEFLRGTEPTAILMTAVALAVAAIPEGLPVALTVALSISVSRMARRDVVVRKMAAVEGLGACTMIAADKTGTLTVNELSVQRVFLPEHGDMPVSSLVAGNEAVSEPFNRLVIAGLLCNEARLEEQVDGSHQLFGDTVDGALLKLGIKAGFEHAEIDASSPRKGRIPYEPSLSFAASFHAEDNNLHGWVKGAVEVVLSFCKQEQKQGVLEQVNNLAGQGFKVIALAEGIVQGMTREDLKNLNFLGLVALIDPLRASAQESIRRCEEAGVEVRMITGDHPLTALEIGRQLDLAESEEDVVTGARLAALEHDTTAMDAIVARTRVFARVAPLQKLTIVQSMQRAGNTVAVTGDGVNDASALAAADIGAAMGRSGTDIARNAADLILVDDELASLADGIEEGRIAYDNIRKVIYLLISTGAAELVLFMASIIAGLPLPLTPVQLLWLNLVTQGIQDVALAFEKGEPGVLNRRPRPPKEGIFNRQMVEQTLLSGLVVGGIAFLMFQFFLDAGMSQFAASNQLLLVLILFENAHVFNCRSEVRSAFAIPIRNNPFLVGGVILVQLIHLGAMNIPGLSSILDIQPLDIQTYAWSALPAISIVLVMEFYKFSLRSRKLDDS